MARVKKHNNVPVIEPLFKGLTDAEFHLYLYFMFRGYICTQKGSNAVKFKFSTHPKEILTLVKEALPGVEPRISTVRASCFCNKTLPEKWRALGLAITKDDFLTLATSRFFTRKQELLILGYFFEFQSTVCSLSYKSPNIAFRTKRFKRHTALQTLLQDTSVQYKDSRSKTGASTTILGKVYIPKSRISYRTNINRVNSMRLSQLLLTVDFPFFSKKGVCDFILGTVPLHNEKYTEFVHA